MKKIIRYILISTGVLLILCGGYYFAATGYHGNKEIILLDAGDNYSSFSRIINRAEFKGKIVYVDVWGTSCPSCFEEFSRYTPALLRRYHDARDITFLYICIDRHPFGEWRWKKLIKKFKPAGYHVLITANEEARLATDIVGEAVDGKFFPYQPFYFILDKQGKFIEHPDPDPGRAEYAPSDTTKLYHKLDSLRSL